MTSLIVSDPSPGVRQLILNRPDRRNALDLEMVTALSDAVGNGAADVVIVGSTDQAAFSSGVDLTVDPSERAEVSRALYSLYRQIRMSDSVVVAAVSGHAIGGGAQLMIASDLRVASPGVSIKFAGAGHGLVVGAWGLPGLVGPGRAMELILTMRAVDAQEALAIGLVDRIEDDPLSWAIEFAQQVATLPEGVARAAKRVAAAPEVLEALEVEREHNDRWDGAIPARAEDDPG